MDDSQWYRLNGQVHALKAGMLALIASHPNKALIARHLQISRTAAEARALPEPVPEEFLSGMQGMLDDLTRMASTGD